MHMILLSRFTKLIIGASFIALMTQCNSTKNNNDSSINNESFIVQAEDFIATEHEVVKQTIGNDGSFVKTKDGGWLTYKINVPAAGRYKVELFAQTPDTALVNCWIEDYVGNKDGRSYNITGNMALQTATDNTNFKITQKDGSPLDSGVHTIRLHVGKGNVMIDKIAFTLLKPHKNSPIVLTQKTDGKEWKLTWSDEFNGKGLPDTTKWTFDLGDWGWGNNELQYYTENEIKNARQEDGNLIIEAIKNEGNLYWTSARLTTRGKESFLYGKIEFRAKVPVGEGAWAAGWLLGDNYRDELSWPYCGEVDILENVGCEIDNVTGNGKTHASVHCGAYYFKLGNQPTAIIDVKNMGNAFHDYTMEWLPTGMIISIDGKKYFEYKDTATDLSWPFNKPQNLILNLAMGGGMGRDVDPTLTSQKLIVDYVRVYELQ